MPDFDVMVLIAVGAYMIGDVMLARGERTESEAWLLREMAERYGKTLKNSRST